MKSIRTKITLLTVSTILIALGIATAIGVISIRKLGTRDADQMLHLTASTGAMNLEAYFDSVEHSVETVAALVQDSFAGMTPEDLESHVEETRTLFKAIAYNTNGVLTYYFRIDPEFSDTVKGFWYVRCDDTGFLENEVTDISQYDTSDTSQLVWFTIPKTTGKGIWLPPYYTENLDVRVISYNIPVYWKSQFIGVIGIEIDYRTLTREVENIRIFDTGYAFIVDKNSNFIYHPQMSEGQLTRETNAIDNPSRFVGGNHVEYVYGGVEKEAVWSPLSNGMRLYVSAPVSEIDSGWRKMFYYTLVASLVLLAAAGLVMLRFSDRLTKPLRDLTEAAKQAQNGNYDFRLEYSKNDEVGILTETFRQLTAKTRANLTEAREMAVVDSLTGVKNKNAYAQREKQMDEQIRRGETEPFAVVVCDVNNLKQVNDLYGHREGDTCIRNACAKICGVFSHSPVFRTGGDEFVVILTGEDFSNRVQLMDKINAFPLDRSKIRMGETLSAGIAEFNKFRHQSFSAVFEEADKAMYERKQYMKEHLLPTEIVSDSSPVYEDIPVIHARKHILVVDDAETTRQLLEKLLQEEYTVTCASDGTEALEILHNRKNEIDLVLLDLQMPNRSGLEVLAEMQVDEDLMSIPVIFLTVDQTAELDCLRSGAMDFIPKPLPDAEIVRARIARCIELSENRELVRYTERDRLTGLLNRDYFIRYVSRLDHIYKDAMLDAVVCDVNQFRAVNRQYGRQYGDQVLRSIGNGIRKLARKTGGICCRQDGDTFLVYCLHQEDYGQLLREFESGLFNEKETAERISLRFGIYINAKREPNVEERFVRAKIAAERTKDDPQKNVNLYDLV